MDTASAVVAGDIRLQMDCSGLSLTGHGTSDLVLPLISLFLLTQAGVIISPLGGDASDDSTDSIACGLNDTETVLRRLLPALLDSQKCPALTEFDFSSPFSCQTRTLGGAGVAGDIPLQIDCSGLSLTGHETGDMSVPFISFLLLRQARVVINPLGGDASADSTDGNACGLHDTEAVLRWLLPAAIDSQKCLTLTEFDFSSPFSCQPRTLQGPAWLVTYGYK
ncbi:hypothetical protein MRX96_000165 [Rhipicephalus microplus]